MGPVPSGAWQHEWTRYAQGKCGYFTIRIAAEETKEIVFPSFTFTQKNWIIFMFLRQKQLSVIKLTVGNLNMANITKQLQIYLMFFCLLMSCKTLIAAEQKPKKPFFDWAAEATFA